jgi:hypothetical protein
VFAETSGDEPRAQDVLHWLAQAKVHRQRERGQKLCQPEARVSFARFHGQSLRSGWRGLAYWQMSGEPPMAASGSIRILLTDG